MQLSRWSEHESENFKDRQRVLPGHSSCGMKALLVTSKARSAPRSFLLLVAMPLFLVAMPLFLHGLLSDPWIFKAAWLFAEVPHRSIMLLDGRRRRE